MDLLKYNFICFFIWLWISCCFSLWEHPHGQWLFFLTAALLPHSALYTAPFTKPSNGLCQSKQQETKQPFPSNRQTFTWPLSQALPTNQWHSRQIRGSTEKSRPLQVADSFQHSAAHIKTSKHHHNIVWPQGHATRHPVTQHWPAIPSTVIGPAGSCNRTNNEPFPATVALCSAPPCILSSASLTSIPSPTIN